MLMRIRSEIQIVVVKITNPINPRNNVVIIEKSSFEPSSFIRLKK